jgi:dihydroorotate dehydrogenase
MSSFFRGISNRLLPSRSTAFVVGAGSLLVGLEYTTQIPSTKFRSTLLYHHIADQVVTPMLRRCFDPETAHHVAIYFAQHGFAPIHHPSAIEQRCRLETKIEFSSSKQRDEVEIKPLHVPNVIGLAAGFDKDAVIIQPMLLLGFGFTEVGTITLEPQPGNPKPRMFRLPSDLAIINRYGFNSPGSTVVEENLMKYRKTQADESNHGESEESVFSQLAHWLFHHQMVPSGAVGINLGLNKSSIDEDDVMGDYTKLIKKLGPYGDYLVVNISSPNTPGLREWQTDADGLRSLLAACLNARNSLATSTSGLPPLFVKLAPDLTDEELIRIAGVCEEVGINGFVVANTTKQRPADLIHHHLGTIEEGGLSGRPVRDLSTSMIRTLYAATEGRMPIIGVGGVSSGHDAYEKLRAGASLVQVYSHLVYEGPGFVSRLRQELAELLVMHGHRNVADVIGLDHEDITWKKRHERLALEEKTVKQLYGDSTSDDDNDTTDVTSVS